MTGCCYCPPKRCYVPRCPPVRFKPCPIDWDAISKPQPQPKRSPPSSPTGQPPRQRPRPSSPEVPPPAPPADDFIPPLLDETDEELEEDSENEIVFTPDDGDPGEFPTGFAPQAPPDDEFPIGFAPQAPGEEWFEDEPVVGTVETTDEPEDTITVEDPGVDVEDEQPTAQEEAEDEEEEETMTNNGGGGGPPTSNGHTADINNFGPIGTATDVNGGVPGIARATLRSNNVVTNQNPDSIWWIPQPVWDASTWDGVSTIDPGTMTTAQACAWLWPASNDVLRGTKELYANFGGFADEVNPTPLEIENYFVAYVLHFRQLTQNPTPLAISPCLMLRSLWSDERAYSQHWDTLYPGPACGHAEGPCVDCGGHTNPHCGEAFIPNSADQQVYLDDINITGPCSLLAGSAGLHQTNADIPWAIKLSRIMQSWYCGHDAHFGPFMGRELLGFHMLQMDGAHLWRGKWGGPLNAYSYNVPTDW